MKNSKRMIINMVNQLKKNSNIFKEYINRHRNKIKMSIDDMKVEFSQVVVT